MTQVPPQQLARVYFPALPGAPAVLSVSVNPNQLPSLTSSDLGIVDQLDVPGDEHGHSVAEEAFRKRLQ